MHESYPIEVCADAPGCGDARRVFDRRSLLATRSSASGVSFAVSTICRGGGSGEAVALVVSDQLVVSQALLVDLRAL